MRFDSLLRRAGPASFAILCVATVGDEARGQLTEDQKDDIGIATLRSALGPEMPEGDGLSVSQIEAQESGWNYRPDSEIFTDKTFEFRSGGSTGTSDHATTVGHYLYGSGSLAPAIGRTLEEEVVTVYEASHFLNNMLRIGSRSVLPAVETNEIQNHSWIGSYTDDDLNREAIRRMDFAIQRDDFVAVFGLDNNRGTTVPNLLSGAYNGITVGLSDGNHSSGGSSIEGAARTRPDLVVPTTATSWAVATVSGASALLIQTARETAGRGNGDGSLVVKSLLMAGATRDESEFVVPWANSSTQPLDAVYGAGELNINRSHSILTAGEFDADNAAVAGPAGWDAGTSSATIPAHYFFDLNDPTVTCDVAGGLVWNRVVTATDVQPGPGTEYRFDTMLPNLDLRLFEASGFALGKELSASVSTVDNVELVVFGGLGSGRYAWQVTSDTEAIDYGFSWHVEATRAVPEPSVVGLLLLMLPLVASRRCR